jgi:lipopolysaccharide biosynthesis glycosyltransferase
VFDGVSFENKQNGTDLYRFMVNLRLLLPEIFASQLLPEALRNIDSFLWLDSDLIVYGNLSDLWTIAAAHPNQRMIGVDLHYDHSNPNYLAVAEEVPMELEASSTISGGVVFWDIRQIIEDCRAIRRNVFADTISQIIDSRLDEMGLSLSDGQSAAGIYNYSTEEPVFTKYAYETLRRSAPNEPFCWFPLAYNVAKISHLPFFEGKTDDIVIFHWDSMIKPWDFRATVLRPDYLYTPQAVKLFKKQVRSWIGIAEELNCAIKVRVTF